MQSAIAYHLTTCPQFVTFTGRNADWTDTHIPRTERPVRFQYDRVGRDKFASVLNVYWPYASLGWRYSA